ncbi:MAG: hypothetical protein AAGA77_25185, partial [Bacteroidota bacterium]
CDCPDGFEGEFCQDKIIQLKMIYLDGQVYETFTYDENGDLSQRGKYSNNGTLHFTAAYNYDEDSLVIRYVHHVSGSESFLKFEDIGNNEIRREFIPNGVSTGEYYIYKDVNQSCGYSGFEIYSTNGIFFSDVSIEYRDEHCSNLRIDRNIHFDSIYFRRETTNDEFNYPFPKGKNRFLPEPNRGNTIKLVLKDGGIELNALNSYTSTFSYNEDRYPVEEVRTYYNGDTETYSYEYY